jgi:hypothetical protein
MTEIEIINNNTEIISNNTEIINNNFEDKPIIDRRRIKKIKKVEEDIQPVEKIDKRTIKRAPWRTTILEDGTIKYNDRPCDPLYFKKYYDEKRKAIDGAIITCQLCQREVTSGHIHRHQRSNICKKYYNLRLNTDEKPSENTI